MLLKQLHCCSILFTMQSLLKVLYSLLPLRDITPNLTYRPQCKEIQTKAVKKGLFWGFEEQTMPAISCGGSSPSQAECDSQQHCSHFFKWMYKKMICQTVTLFSPEYIFIHMLYTLKRLEGFSLFAPWWTDTLHTKHFVKYNKLLFYSPESSMLIEGHFCESVCLWGFFVGWLSKILILFFWVLSFLKTVCRHVVTELTLVVQFQLTVFFCFFLPLHAKRNLGKSARVGKWKCAKPSLILEGLHKGSSFCHRLHISGGRTEGNAVFIYLSIELCTVSCLLLLWENLKDNLILSNWQKRHILGHWFNIIIKNLEIGILSSWIYLSTDKNNSRCISPLKATLVVEMSYFFSFLLSFSL